MIWHEWHNLMTSFPWICNESRRHSRGTYLFTMKRYNQVESDGSHPTNSNLVGRGSWIWYVLLPRPTKLNMVGRGSRISCVFILRPTCRTGVGRIWDVNRWDEEWSMTINLTILFWPNVLWWQQQVRITCNIRLFSSWINKCTYHEPSSWFTLLHLVVCD
jgi:hypothetical protein